MISKLAYVDPSAKIADDVTVHPFAYIDKDVEIGPGCEIFPYASVMRGTRMGARNKVYQGAVIGADPQDFRWKGQPSYCYIGDKNIFREQVIINRGFGSEDGTRIGNKCFIMAESHIGHDTQIKGHTVIGNGVKIAGNVIVDENTILSSNVVLHENTRVAKWVFIKGGCRISSNVPPYVIMAHNPVNYYGVNSVIMQKDGKFSDKDIEDVAKAYRHIYQTDTSTYNALRRIMTDIDESPVRNEILDFVRLVNEKLAGKKHLG